MKLFQRLLVAPAALGLFSPLVANATEVNLNNISNYSDVESIDLVNSFDNEKPSESPKLAGGEGLIDSYSPSGGFSDTTTASFSVDFGIGSVDGLGIATGDTEGDESIQAVYGFQIDLNTSFTGEDSLDISLDAGNGSSTGALSELDLNGYGATSADSDKLVVDGISYTFPVGDSVTMIVGDNTDGSALFTTACVYGGPSNTLDDCGNVNAGITNGGVAVGAVYDCDNGWTAAVGYAAAETGLMTNATTDAYGVNGAYTGDNYGVSLTYGYVETGVNGVTENYYTALNGYYSFDFGWSISGGYEVGDIGANADAADESINWFLGINGELGSGELGAAVGTSGGQTENTETEHMGEVYYSYPVNDGMTITPLIYIKEQATGGTPDQTGVMVKTSFSF